MKRYRLLTLDGWPRSELYEIHNEDDLYPESQSTIKNLVKSYPEDWEEVKDDVTIESILTNYFTDKNVSIKTNNKEERIILCNLLDKLEINYHKYNRHIINDNHTILYSYREKNEEDELIRHTYQLNSDETIIKFSDILEEIKQLNK